MFQKSVFDQRKADCSYLLLYNPWHPGICGYDLNKIIYDVSEQLVFTEPRIVKIADGSEWPSHE